MQQEKSCSVITNTSFLSGRGSGLCRSVPVHSVAGLPLCDQHLQTHGELLEKRNSPTSAALFGKEPD